jgi:hypothetical protein
MAMDANEALDLQTVSEPGTLFSLLDEDNKSIVRPFLTTKFCIAPRQRGPPGALPFFLLLTTCNAQPAFDVSI